MGRFPEIFSAEDVAKQFKLHPYTVRRLARKKKIPAFKFGGQWRFREEDLIEVSKFHPISKDVTPFLKSGII